MADKKYNIGVGLAVDGEKEFKNAITGINSDLKVLKSELGRVSAEYSNNSNSMKAYAAKAKVVTSQITEQKNKIATLKNALESAKKEYGDNSKQVKEWQIQLSNAERDLSKMNNELEKTPNGLKLLNGQAGLSENAMRKLKVGIAAVATALGALFIAGAKQGLEFNAQMEQYTISFETMTGSAEKATQITEKLKDIAAKTPFEMTDVANTTQLLMQYGLSADDAVKSLKVLGDISQGNAERLNRVAIAYGQMTSAGKVQLQDIKQMIEAGFNPLNEISKQTGESMQSLYSRISKGTIGVYEITEAMENATSEGGKFFGSTEKQSQTMTGQISTLKDEIKNKLGEALLSTSDKITTEVLPAMIEFIKSIDISQVAESIANIMKVLSDLAKVIIDNKDTIISAIASIGSAILAFNFVQKIASWATALKEFKTVVQAVALGTNASISSMAGPIGIVAAALTALAVKAYSDFKKTQNRIEKERKDVIDKAYKKQVEAVDKSYEKQTEGLNAEKDALTKSYNRRVQDINTYYAKQEKSIANNLKSIKKSLDDENKAYQEAHKQRLAEIEELKAKRYAEIDEQANSATAKLQAEIDAIDAQTLAEQKAEKERQNNQKLIDLRNAILLATSVDEKIKTQKELNNFLSELENAKVQEEREQQKAVLKLKIDNINSEADEKKKLVDVEIEQQKQASEQILLIQQEAVNKKLEALDGYNESEKARLEASKETALQIEQAKLDDYKLKIDEKIAKIDEQIKKEKELLDLQKEIDEENAKATLDDVLKETDLFRAKNGVFSRSGGGAIWGYAKGTDDFSGGLAKINEKGGEIVNLPQHTQIIPHDISLEMAREYARKSATSKQIVFNNNNYFSNTSNREGEIFIDKINRQLGIAYGV